MADLVRCARDPRGSLRARHAAFAKLVERFQGMAFATALQWADGPEAARDVCQEAFLVAWRQLSTLREPDAFGGWLKRLLRTQCARVRRQCAATGPLSDSMRESVAHDTAEVVARREVQRLLRLAVGALPAREREAIVLFYFLGESLREIGRTQGVSAGVAGKRVYAARLRLRRALPRSVTEAFLTTAATPAFARRVRAGVLDEFVGEYRFPNRPHHPVVLRREGDLLASYAAGQRHILASGSDDTLLATEFDGEARFHRDRRGRIRHFVYYEFGRRMGLAHKVE